MGSLHIGPLPRSSFNKALRQQLLWLCVQVEVCLLFPCPFPLVQILLFNPRKGSRKSDRHTSSILAPRCQGFRPAAGSLMIVAYLLLSGGRVRMPHLRQTALDVDTNPAFSLQS